MEDDRGVIRPYQAAGRALPGHGGTLEPANRAEVAKEMFQAPREPKEPIAPMGAHFELRDAASNQTYRAKTMPEIAAKADEMGIKQLTAIDKDGSRLPLRKVEGQWIRDGERQPPLPSPALASDRPGRAEREQTGAEGEMRSGKVVSMRGQIGEPPSAVMPRQSDPPGQARLDMQAERNSRVAQLESDLRDRYVVKRTSVTLGDVTVGSNEYRFKGDTARLAFTASTFKLATETNSPSVARSMVDLAETRGWKAIRVSGHEDFRRQVWMEASVRGVKALGYEPLPSDLARLRSEQEARRVNRIEPGRDAGERGSSAGAGRTTQAMQAEPSAEKGSARGGGGRKAVLAAIDAVLVAKGVPERKRELVMAAATEKLAQRVREGQTPKVKVYDKAAPQQRPVAVPAPELQRARDRAVPAPSR